MENNNDNYIEVLLQAAVLFGFVLLMAGGLFVSWLIGG